MESALPIKHPSYHATRTPDKLAYRIADNDQGLTYAALNKFSNQGAQLLRASGLQAGEGHIALLMENSLDFFKICWSAQRSGIYYTPISTYLKPSEILYILRDSGAAILFISARLLKPLAEALTAEFPKLRVITAGEPVTGFESLDDALADQPASPIADEVVGLDMLYSSGTTGMPKGVQPSFKGDPLGTTAPLITLLGERMCGLNADSIYLSPAPLYHAAPLRFTMLCAALGASVIIMPRFDPEHFLRLLHNDHVTHTQVVPTMFVRLLKLPPELRNSFDISHLKAVVHAAAPCPQDVKLAMIDWWGPILLEYYAGTEGNGVTIINSTEWLTHRGSVGRSLLGSIKILGDDKDDEPLPPGEIGDVYFADTPAFTYLNDPAKTAAAYNRKGWSTLGDVGYLDEEGYLYLTDRKAYMIISGGVNIYPQEAENILVAHPSVLDVAVFGVPNPEMGEEVKAVVQPASGETGDARLEAELIAYCKERLSAIKCPRSIDFVDEMPRTPTGKLLKRRLRDRYWAR